MDVYSYGMILWELASRKLPFLDAPDEMTARGWIEDGERENIPADCPKAYGELIQDTWLSEERRPVVGKVVERLSAAKLTATTVENIDEQNSTIQSNENKYDIHHASEEKKQESPATQYKLALKYYAEDNHSLAMSYFQALAEAGNARAQYYLGVYYLEDKIVDVDLEKAFSYFHMSADQGDAEAQYRLSLLYFDDNSPKMDYKNALKYCQLSAEQGYDKAEKNLALLKKFGCAQLKLALQYYHGQGFEINLKLAFENFQLAADLQNTEAQYYLAVCYEKGQGVTQDYKKAVQYWEQAASQGYMEAQYKLGLKYYLGEGVERDYKLAVQYFQNAAAQGYADAQYYLAICYENSHGVLREDKQEAFKYFHIAADNGNTKAQYRLGMWYLEGDNFVVSKNTELGLKYLKMVAGLTGQGDAEAQFTLASLYLMGKSVKQDYKEAIKYYQLSAEKGHIEAKKSLELCKQLGCTQLNLGLKYYNGQDVVMDFKLAVKYFQDAVDLGNIEALYHLGICYQNGQGITQDGKISALTYFRLAAEKGNAKAQYHLGMCYLEGNLARKDTVDGLQYLQLAADQGNPEAQFNLGLRYLKGQDVKKDYKQALRYYQLAAAQGNTDAKKSLELCYELGCTQFDLGFKYYYGLDVEQDCKLAMAYYQNAADLGNVDAQYFVNNQENANSKQKSADKLFNLGLKYYHGDGVQKNYEIAIKNFGIAAKMEHIEAQYYLGYCYENGLGVMRNFSRAIEHYLLAANQDHAEAQYKLGSLYLKEDIAEKNYKQAVIYLKLSAKQGNENAKSSLVLCKELGCTQFELGYKYHYGVEVGRDCKLAMAYYQDAVNLGFNKAEYYVDNPDFVNSKEKSADKQFNLGLNYYDRHYEYELAVKHFGIAANLGHAESQYRLGSLYLKGQGVEKNYKQAIIYFKLSAEQGNEGAKSSLRICANLAKKQLDLGLKYHHGQDVTPDKKLAMEHYQVAADLGNEEAQYYLDNPNIITAINHNIKSSPNQEAENEKIVITRNFNINNSSNPFLKYINQEKIPTSGIEIKSEPEIKLQAEINNEPSNNDGVKKRGKITVNPELHETIPPEIPKDLPQLHRKKDQGSNEYNLGIQYYYGRGVDQNYQEAVKYFQQAANINNAKAQYNLAYCYEKGRGIVQDSVLAVQYYQLAANQNHIRAQYKLALCYEKGRGTAKDEKLAMQYYQLAADNGDIDAKNALERIQGGIIAKPVEQIKIKESADTQFALGFQYFMGQDVEHNDELALKLFTLAADQGHGKAQFYLGIIYACGYGVEKNKKISTYYHLLSASQGIASEEKKNSKTMLNSPVLRKHFKKCSRHPHGFFDKLPDDIRKKQSYEEFTNKASYKINDAISLTDVFKFFLGKSIRENQRDQERLNDKLNRPNI